MASDGGVPESLLSSAAGVIGTGRISGAMAFDNLYPAVVECFFVIVCGYVAGKASMISPFEAKGLNTFVGTFALPALIFLSMAELDFRSVNWRFLLAVFLSKTAVFAVVALITALVVRPVDFGKSGLFAIFCTQSNDFALGYPIIVSLYKDIHPEFPTYLYLLAPVSLVFLNPIGFTLMEWQKRRKSRQSGGCGGGPAAGPPRLNHQVPRGASLLVQIFVGVAKNPVVFMTVLGVVGNFVFGHFVPPVLAQILKVLASAYPATALFVLGLRLVGSLRRLRGAALVVPAILIMTKGLVLPLITREMVGSLHPGSNANETKDFTDYGFLYGTFPTAPPVFVYAAQYNIEVDMIASAMVIGTFLSALVMFVSAKMVTLRDISPVDYMAELDVFLLNVAIFGAAACAAVVSVLLLARRWRRVPHFFTLCLVVSQMIACFGVVMWALVDCQQAWKLYLQFFIFSWGVFSSRVWTALLAVSLVLLHVRPDETAILKWRKWFCVVGWILPAGVVACLLGFVATEAEVLERRDPNFQYGRTQAIVALIVLVSAFLCTLLSLILQQRLRRAAAGHQEGMDVVGRGQVKICRAAAAAADTVGHASETEEAEKRLIGDEDEDDWSEGGDAAARVIPPNSCRLFELDDADSPSSSGVAGEMEVLEEVPDTASFVGSENVPLVRGRGSSGELHGRGDWHQDCVTCVPDNERSRWVEREWGDVKHYDDNVEDKDNGDEDFLNEFGGGGAGETHGHRRRRRPSRLASEAAANRLRRQQTAALQQMRLSMLSMQDDDAIAVPMPPSAFEILHECSARHLNRQPARQSFLEHGFGLGLDVAGEGIENEDDGGRQVLRHVVLLLVLCTSMLVGISLCLWTLFVEEKSGIYIELVFLDVALNFGQGFFVCALFGLDEKFVLAPLLRKWRRCFRGTAEVKPPPPERLSAETLLVCSQFVTYHMDRCMRDILRDRRVRGKLYRRAFCGNELVDWLLVVGLAPDRAQAARYGEHLLTACVLRHYDGEHHFHDQPLLYTFCNKGGVVAANLSDVNLDSEAVHLATVLPSMLPGGP